MQKARDDTFAHAEAPFGRLTHFPGRLFTLWRQRRRRRPSRQLQTGPAQGSRTLQSGPAGDAALPELPAALLRKGRLTARLRRSRLRRADRVCRRSLLRSRLWRARLLQSLPAWLTGLLWLTGPRRLAGLTRLLRLARPRLQVLSVRRARLLLSRTILRSWLLWCASTVLPWQTVLPLRATRLTRLAGPDRPVRIHKARVGAAEGALLVEHAAAEDLRRVYLTHKTLVAHHHLRRHHQWHRGETRTSAAWPDGKAARALRQKAEPRAGTIVDLDAADPAVGIRIEFYRDVVGSCGGSACRHLDEARGAANARVAVGVVIFMSPVFATAAATKATVPLAMSNTPAFCLPPSS